MKQFLRITKNSFLSSPGVHNAKYAFHSCEVSYVPLNEDAKLLLILEQFKHDKKGEKQDINISYRTVFSVHMT